MDKDGADGSADAAAASLRALGLRDGDDDRDGGGGSAMKGSSPTLGNLTEVALFCDVVERALTYSPDERIAAGARGVIRRGGAAEAASRGRKTAERWTRTTRRSRAEIRRGGCAVRRSHHERHARVSCMYTVYP